MRQDPDKQAPINTAEESASRQGNPTFEDREALTGRIESIINELSLDTNQEIEDITERLFNAMYGDGYAELHPEAFEEFKNELSGALEGVSEDQKREVITQTLEKFLESESKGSDEPATDLNQTKIQEEPPAQTLKKIRISLDSIKVFGFAIAVAPVGALMAGGGGVHENTHVREYLESDDSRADATKNVEEVSQQQKKELEELGVLVDDVLEKIHKQYRQTLIEALASLAAEKANQEKNRLLGFFELEADDLKKKSMRIAEAERIIQEAIIVLSAFRGSDTYIKLERVAERLKQVHNINRAFQVPVRLLDVIEEVDSHGFSVLR